MHYYTMVNDISVKLFRATRSHAKVWTQHEVKDNSIPELLPTVSPISPSQPVQARARMTRLAALTGRASMVFPARSSLRRGSPPTMSSQRLSVTWLSQVNIYGRLALLDHSFRLMFPLNPRKIKTLVSKCKCDVRLSKWIGKDIYLIKLKYKISIFLLFFLSLKGESFKRYLQFLYENNL